MSNKVIPITIDQLESYLWGAAVLLRGQIDATDLSIWGIGAKVLTNG